MFATALSRHAKAVTQRMNGGRLDVPTLAEVRELLENVSIAFAAEGGEYPKVAASVHAIALCLQLPPSRTRITTTQLRQWQRVKDGEEELLPALKFRCIHSACALRGEAPPTYPCMDA